MDFTRKFFDPTTMGTLDEKFGTVTVSETNGKDDNEAIQYVYKPETILAVNLALAANRPLLVAGPPGSGKTTLARNVAKVLQWRYYGTVVTSRTAARDLMWEFDALKRLNDASDPDRDLLDNQEYLDPGVLWWSFDGKDANGVIANRKGLEDPSPAANQEHAVTLIDEIDKADPDVPNDLLEALDVGRFTVTDLDHRVVKRKNDVLLLITTNGERELPPAFMRRCVFLQLPTVTENWLVNIANQRFGAEDADFHREVAAAVMKLCERAREQGFREPSTAEFIDAVKACRPLDVKTKSKCWKLVEEALLWKRTKPTII